jgi:haloalkane dehalogenase
MRLDREAAASDVSGRELVGVGPTMVFIHAGPARSFVYRDLIVRLHDRFRCVALDLPGTGLSPAAAGYRPSIQAAASVFSASVRALDLRRVTLVTHDVGTSVALGAAIGMPERVVGLWVTEGFAWALQRLVK